MLYAVVIVFAICGLYHRTDAEDTCGQRTVGPGAKKITDVPWIVLIQENGKTICVAVVVREKPPEAQESTTPEAQESTTPEAQESTTPQAQKSKLALTSRRCSEKILKSSANYKASFADGTERSFTGKKISISRVDAPPNIQKRMKNRNANLVEFNEAVSLEGDIKAICLPQSDPRATPKRGYTITQTYEGKVQEAFAIDEECTGLPSSLKFCASTTAYQAIDGAPYYSDEGSGFTVWGIRGKNPRLGNTRSFWRIHKKRGSTKKGSKSSASEDGDEAGQNQELSIVPKTEIGDPAKPSMSGSNSAIAPVHISQGNKAWKWKAMQRGLRPSRISPVST